MTREEGITGQQDDDAEGTKDGEEGGKKWKLQGREGKGTPILY